MSDLINTIYLFLEFLTGIVIGILLRLAFEGFKEAFKTIKAKSNREIRNYTIEKGSLKWMIDREFKKRNQLKN